MSHYHLKIQSYLAVLAFLLTACTVTPSSPLRGKPLTEQYRTAGSLRQFAQSAQEQHPLQTAELLLQQHRLQEAKGLAAATPIESLAPPLHNARFLLQAHLNLAEQQPKAALYALSKIQQSDLLSEETKLDLLHARALALQQLGYPIESAEVLIQADNMLVSEPQKHANRQQIWRILNKASTKALQQTLTGSDSALNGWLALTLLMKENNESADQFAAALALWRENYPQHPAHSLFAENAPNLIQGNHFAQPVEKIALLLPLSGQLANSAAAVRDGLLAAFYHHSPLQTRRPTIDIIDTVDEASIIADYQQAVSQGADWVIGPLSKPGLQKLYAQRKLPIPILALNQIDLTTEPALKHANLYQLSLSPEHEVAAVAAHAWQQNKSQALVLTPANDWGTRLATKFQQEWQQLGGSIVQTATYNGKGDLARTIQQSLNLDKSHNRTRKLQRLLGLSFDYTVRRRADIDMIFLAASPDIARQIAPLLAFYFAADIPIFATASVYNGIPMPQLDKDMNGTTFCDAPWIITEHYPDQTLLKTVHTLWPNNQAYSRMHALGIDAYKLLPFLQRLKNFPTMQYQGATGTLSLNTYQQFDRALPCAQFSRGKLLSVPKEQHT